MYCRNCGKEITSIADECPYCKTKTNVNNDINNQNNSQNTNNNGLNKNLYNGMNGQPVPLWKFIIGLILLGGGLFLAFSTVL